MWISIACKTFACCRCTDMACCVVGSLLMVGVAAVVRWLQHHLLHKPAETPETWRLL